ncbi:MAG: hypothetical protein ACLRSD_08675 [Oscillibacter sp.]
MIKKRLLSFLGAAAITAALTFAVVSLSPSNGFTLRHDAGGSLP